MDEKNDLPQYEITVGLDPESEENVIRTSLVDDPATQKMFAVFSKENQQKQKFKIVLPTEQNEQIVSPKNGEFQKIISGVWFMPDTDYIRVDDNGFFTTRITRENLKKAVSNFIKAGSVNNFNVMHEGGEINGLQTVEMWILNDYKQVSPILGNSIEDLGYTTEDIPLGTVLMSVFISDEEFFKKMILSGEVKGFSIEAFFNLNKKKFSSMSKSKNELMFNKLGVNLKEGKILTSQGELNVTSTGVTIGGTAVTDAEFKTSSNFKIVVRGGKVADFGFETEAPAAPAVETAAPAVETTEAPATVETPSEDADFDTKVKQAIQKDREDQAAKTKAAEEKAAEDKKLQDALDEVERLKQEKNNNLLSKPLGKKSVDKSTINEATHRVIKRGKKEYTVPR